MHYQRYSVECAQYTLVLLLAPPALLALESLEIVGREPVLEIVAPVLEIVAPVLEIVAPVLEIVALAKGLMDISIQILGMRLSKNTHQEQSLQSPRRSIQ